MPWRKQRPCFRGQRVTARVLEKKYTQMSKIKILSKCHISSVSKINHLNFFLILKFLNEVSAAEELMRRN